MPYGTILYIKLIANGKKSAKLSIVILYNYLHCYWQIVEVSEFS